MTTPEPVGGDPVGGEPVVGAATAGATAAAVRERGGPRAWWLRAGLIGVAAGVMAGLFGVGGGIVMVPMFVAWFGLDQRRASATSLLAIIPIAAASATGYAVNGNVDPDAALLLLIGGVIGGTIGARLLPRVPIPTLQLWFGVLSLLTAVRLFVEDPAASSGTGGAIETALLLLVGVLAGVLAGLLGVGGGIIMVPGLVLLAGDDPSTARGTSLVVVVLTAVSATVTNLRNDLVAVRVAIVAGLVGAPSGLVGAAVGQAIPEGLALALFSVLLAWSGVSMLRRSRRGRAQGRPPAPVES